MLFLVVLQVFSPFRSVVEYDAKEPKSSECFTYSLSANHTSVLEGYQIQFTFEYESVEPACAPEDITGDQIVIDFSPLVNSDGDITTSADTEIFDIVISPTGYVLDTTPYE